MEIESFAKVNLYLEITGKRPDGYHELITLMCPIDLHDTLRIEFNTAASRVACSHPDVPEDGSNLAIKAARRFFDATSCRDHISIGIDKRIPVGAGLGGGSSNAAAVLNALNRRYETPLSRHALMDLAGTIGADVPFFVYGRPALATGIGDRLTAYEQLPEAPIVLIYPRTPVSTAVIYQKLNFGLTKTKKINKKSIFRHIQKKGISRVLYNDFEPTAFKIYPEIAEAKSALLAQGALGALMSGSGSSVFGIYPDTVQAHNAYTNVKGRYPQWEAFMTRLRIG
ncbi:MAG: 4-(cytidine 5'-diphospho)-2-C-methyl-D-erythritol kinase [Desulfobacterales bacterium]|nr:4-(cytidine 5'-diphospho)-2-C-methyl-D-erythritol kinase [Desulfobacterales bacterium]